MDEHDIVFDVNEHIPLPVYTFGRIEVVRKGLLAVAIVKTDGVLHE